MLSRSNKVVCTCAGRFVEALNYYHLALQDQGADNTDIAKLYSNLSATSAKLGRYAEAATEAAEVVRLQPSWHKGYLRRSHALICLQQYTEALETIEQGLHRARDTASLLEAKEALQDLSRNLQHSKKPKQHFGQQPANSLQAVLGKLKAAGAFLAVLLCWTLKYSMRCNLWPGTV